MLSRTPRLTAGIVAAALVLGACGADVADPLASGHFAPSPAAVASPVSNAKLSAAEGAAARVARDGARSVMAGVSADDSSAKVAATAGDCGIGGVYEPTAEDIAAANADTAAQKAVLSQFGIAFTSVIDEYGFEYLEFDFADIVATSVNDSYWTNRYPVIPPSEAELAPARAEADAIAAALDGIGVDYVRHADEQGWEWIEWDYENPDAQAAVDGVWQALYPPQPPTAEDLERMQLDNDALAAVFEEFGVPYHRVADELGWEWIEWDYEDADLEPLVTAAFEKLYPRIGACGMEDGVVIDDSLVVTGQTGGGEDASTDVAEEAPPVEVLPADDADSRDIGPIEPDSGFTDEQVAQREADVSAMVDGFTSAGIDFEVTGETPWQTVIFDIEHPDAPEVIRAIIDAR